MIGEFVEYDVDEDARVVDSFVCHMERTTDGRWSMVESCVRLVPVLDRMCHVDLVRFSRISGIR